jgi:SulP family sulfate permease
MARRSARQGRCKKAGRVDLEEQLIAARAWLQTYDRRLLRADITAGITLAAYLLPAGIGDASLAGLPPEAGLYACLFSGLVFWLFCSSRVTAVTVTSAISLLVGASLGAISGGDPARQAALAAATALMVAVIAFLAWAVRAGTVVNFLSETVLVGFKVGVAFFLASTQLPKLFGFAGGHGDFWESMGHFFRSLGETNPASLALGATALALLLIGKTVLKNRPVALVVLILGIASAGVLQLDARGVKLLGSVPRGLPVPSVPIVSREDVNTLFPLALACFLLGAVETSAIGRMFAQKRDYRLDATQEFLALAGSNLAAGLMSGFPVSGGTSQSLVNETAGARTPISGLIAALITLIVAVFLAELLHNLPQPVLAAIVLAAVTGLVDVHKLREIWRFDRAEFAVTAVAFLGVLGSGLLNGVLVGVALSIVLLIRRASRPRVVEVGRVVGTNYFADLSRHPENERMPGVLVLRPEGSIVYFNAEFVRAQITALVATCASKPRTVVLFMGSVPFVDLSGATLLAELQRTLTAQEIALRLAETHGEVLGALRRAGVDKPLGASANQTVDDVLRRPES